MRRDQTVATIETYARPTWLYRYRSLCRPGLKGTNRANPEALEQELSAIEAGRVYCSTFDKMNDPMEGFYRASALIKSDTKYAETKDLIYSEKSDLGIASFSETWRDELMWAHYANEFRGICVVYKFESFLKGLGNKYSMARILYEDRPYYLNLKTSKDVSRRAKSILSTKSLKWSYEREWRLFSSKTGLVNHGKGVVPTVYLGMRMAKEDQLAITKRMQKANIDVRMIVVDGYMVKRSQPL